MMSKTAIKEYNTEEIFNFANGCIKGLKPEFLNKIIDNKEHVSITIPKCINGVPVKVIGDRAFIAITNLVEFKLAEDSLVETIENEVFFNCFNLASIDINRPSLCNIGARFMTFRKSRDLISPVVKELDLRNTSLKHITDETFYQSSIESIKLPLSIQSILLSAFKNSALKTINLDELDNLQYVGSNAFANCRIEELPKGFLKSNCSYGTRVFSECYCLKYVYIPSYFKINESGFECCDELLRVDFADENNEIHKKMFKDCLLLQTINLPKELSAICQEAFSGDINLKEIIYPPSLEIVQYGAFSHCANLEKFVPLSESNIRNIGSSAFAYCDNLAEININTPDLKSLGSAAFCYTAHLNKIDLSCSSLETIETNTFARSGLQEILFPKTLRNISNSAFWDNTKLESIDLSETQLTSIGVEAFHNCVRLTDVKLPYFVSIVNKHAFEFTSLNLQDLIKNCPFCEIQNDI